MQYGGGNSLVFFLLKPDFSGLVQADGTTAATAFAHGILTVGRSDEEGSNIDKTNIEIQDDGTVKMSWTHTKIDEKFLEFLALVVPQGQSGGTRAERTAEDGVKYGGNAASGVPVVFIAAGAVGEGNLSTKRETIFSVGYVAKSSGSRSWEPGNPSLPKLEFNSTPAKQAIALAKALFDPALFATPTIADQTIPVNHHYGNKFLAKAA